MSVAAFKANEVKEPVTFTLRASFSSSRLFGPYENMDEWIYGIDLYDRNFDRLKGYVSKASPLGRAIFQILKDGKDHTITLKVQRVAGGGKDEVNILELLN